MSLLLVSLTICAAYDKFLFRNMAPKSIEPRLIEAEVDDLQRDKSCKSMFLSHPCDHDIRRDRLVRHFPKSRSIVRDNGAALPISAVETPFSFA
jgi:hypothetical protein